MKFSNIKTRISPDIARPGKWALPRTIQFDFRRETGHDQFNERDANRRRSTEEVSFDAKDREAFAVLNLEPGCQIKDIKRRHKELAKKFHPDLHGGDKQAEEILKKINQAYTHLLSCGNS
jgi:DnaJ-domain-containing protein 1